MFIYFLGKEIIVNYSKSIADIVASMVRLDNPVQ